jgi:hypothetical protein
MHDSRNENGLSLDCVDHTVRETVHQIAPEAPFQHPPKLRPSKNLLKREFDRFEEFLPESLTAVLIEEGRLT